jgi:hypothetical protein
MSECVQQVNRPDFISSSKVLAAEEEEEEGL